jgi:hypothetical protein
VLAGRPEFGQKQPFNNNRDFNFVWKTMNNSHQCSKCNSVMEEGFLLEKGHRNTLSSESWVAGKPDENSFFGMSLKGKTAYEVKTFRCVACGYLDSYALWKR